MTLAEWRFSARLALQDTFIRWVTLVNVLVALATSVFVLLKLVPEGMRAGVLALHYTIYLGIDDVRAWTWMLLIPAGFIFTLIVNTLLSLGLYRSDALAARAIVGLAAALLCIGSIGAGFLVLINL